MKMENILIEVHNGRFYYILYYLNCLAWNEEFLTFDENKQMIN